MDFVMEDMEGLEDDGTTISDLPSTLLKQQILRHLGPRELCCLSAAGCQHLRTCCDADELWKVLSEERNWQRAGQEPWKKAFLGNMAKLCVSCGNYTKYEFVLTAERLCDTCEQANPDKYALVTACEAIEGHGLSAVELLDLTAPLKKLGTSLYLRSEVQKLKAEKANRARERERLSKGGSSREEADGEEEEDLQGDDEEEEDEEEEETPRQSRSVPKQSKEEKRAARKANKKQVKQLQREKRLHGSSPSSLGNTPSHLGRSPSGTSPPGSGGFHRRKAPSSNSRRQSHVRHTSEACDGLSMRDVSTCSGWIQERERLMSEYGEFGISGLALAIDPPC